MILYPIQAFGIGDVIFCQTLVRSLGNSIVWGVQADYIDSLNRAYPDISFVDPKEVPFDYESKEEQILEDKRSLPIRWADHILKVPYKDCMRAKYQLYGMSFHQWKDKAMWYRNEIKEQQLFEHLGLRPGEKYIFVNRTYQSDFNGTANIDIKTALPVIEMSRIEGFSMFDWAGVLEQASEIHTVSTALFYMLELLDLKCPIHLYPRNNDPRFEHVKYLFTKPYILHR